MWGRDIPVVFVAAAWALAVVFTPYHLDVARGAPLTKECARTDALGVKRVIAIDSHTGPRFAGARYQALPLNPKEVVLTFDDGPIPGRTDKVLKALADECVLATFFMVGREANTHSDLARRVRDEGHTVATHTWAHPNLTELPVKAQIEEIDNGLSAVSQAVGEAAVAPFFRYPMFADTPDTLTYLRGKGVAVFAADIDSNDWTGQEPELTLSRILTKLDEQGGGVVVMHDAQPNTAKVVPLLLGELKARGYSIVHLTPVEP